MAKTSFTVEQLTEPWAAQRRSGAAALVTGVASDSRQVKPGFVFVAVRGFAVDGHEFIGEALERGAVAVVYQDPAAGALIPAEVTAVAVGDSRRVVAELAAEFWGQPSRDLTLVGVTGTSGKTTVSLMIDSIARAAGLSTGVIGTLGISVAGERRPSAHTTPDAVELQGLLADMRDRGVKHVTMEVSSHGLALDRVWPCRFDAAVFTNLSQDHMDFHSDPDDYYLAKQRLFTDYARLAAPEKNLVGVVNLDDAAGERLVRDVVGPVVTYGLGAANVRAGQMHNRSNGLQLIVEFPDRRDPLPLDLPVLGRFNAYNALAAAACAWALGYKLSAIREGLEKLRPVPGRFERVEAGQDFTVVVDYAHKPDALHNVLAAARELQPRRLLCVVGCGGDRDKIKRPQMAQIATTEADWAILTSDNPRTEQPQAIIDDMLAGVVGDNYQVVGDRREAIFEAINRCEPGDLLVIAGKGHERYQIVGDRILPFDDREVALEALASLPPR
ncbi:MAG TPA: UDP-N-acetylmuramoyl-L-alanyl-D-glutamate--2,6-diaminopimelate ligase [Armatimonadota bacterium]|jgi:UDP-N-acetylmuramoyl-L-alanyl-D-glutamate--2,6-diaminopimelate ligase